MARPGSTIHPLRAVALGAVAFAVVEWLATAAWPYPLDAVPSFGEALLAGLGLVGLSLGVALLGGRSQGDGLRRAVAVAALWALVWGPEAARAGDRAVAWGLLPALLFGLLGLRWPRLALLCFALGGAATPLARPSPETQAAPISSESRRPDLLLITLDTVRADAMGSAPAGWSAAGVAVAPAPWTLPSLHALMVGQPVEAQGAGLPVAGGYQARPAGLLGLPERLQAAGYATTAILSNPHLRRDNGFARGFDRFLHSDEAREPFVLLHNLDGLRARLGGGLERRRIRRDACAEVVAIDVLSEPSAAPRFVWVHLLGPHEYGRALEAPLPGWVPGTQDPRVLRAAYAQAVAAGRARALRIAAAAPGAVAVITADHGEAFGEGGRQGHGSALDAAQLEVPLWGRGLDLGCAVARLDGLAAHLLGAVGLPAEGPALCAAEVPVAGLRRDRRAVALRSADGRYVAVARDLPPGPAEALDPDTRDALRAIGYIEPAPED